MCVEKVTLSPLPRVIGQGNYFALSIYYKNYFMPSSQGKWHIQTNEKRAEVFDASCVFAIF